MDGNDLTIGTGWNINVFNNSQQLHHEEQEPSMAMTEKTHELVFFPDCYTIFRNGLCFIINKL